MKGRIRWMDFEKFRKGNFCGFCIVADLIIVMLIVREVEGAGYICT